MSEVVFYGLIPAKISGKEKPNLHLDTLRLNCCMADSILPGGWNTLPVFSVLPQVAGESCF